ncbi:hypothetical protein AB852_28350 [Streptomyces uncialis]|uniref:Uncharacterized protein n=1 Tax=Streptomyces uncialis TaxID=1048205 RepID=A0A1Q4V0Y3_9ACTN|nr:hypothetical protein AB852_28350 [Streptomyces uncialis]
MMGSSASPARMSRQEPGAQLRALSTLPSVTPRTDSPRSSFWIVARAMLGQPQIRVTVKGLRYLHGKLGGLAPLRFEQLRMSA